MATWTLRCPPCDACPEPSLVTIKELAEPEVPASWSNLEALELDLGASAGAPAPAGALRGALARALAALRPGGSLSVSAAAAASFDASDAILVGFEQRAGAGGVAFRRPEWAPAAASRLRARAPAAAAPAAAPAAAASVVHVVPASWAAAGDGELVDEDALLASDAAALGAGARAAPASADASCAPAKRACKNCSCGRKEMEEAEEKKDGGSAAPAPAPAGNVSACGNCAKGDAFRCATCPSRGKPAWKTDTDGAVQLNLADDI